MAADMELVPRQILEHLLHPKQPPGALLLKGKWGVGKTHLWKTQIAPKLKNQKYAHVSLFGIKTAMDLKNKIV